MSRNSGISEIFDEMEELVSELLKSHPCMCADRLCELLAQSGNHQCMIVEKGWRLAPLGGKSQKSYRKIAQFNGFHVFVWAFMAPRPKPNSDGYIRELKAMFVIIER